MQIVLILYIYIYFCYIVSDASGHYSSGYFWGNTFWLGSKSLCTEISEYDEEVPFKLGFNIIKTYIALKAPINYTVNMILLNLRNINVENCILIIFNIGT